MSKLLEDTPEAFYWMGFLLADGSFCSRKWEVIDLSFTSKYIRANQTKQKVAELYNNGMKNKDIARTLGISPATVTKYTKILK